MLNTTSKFMHASDMGWRNPLAMCCDYDQLVDSECFSSFCWISECWYYAGHIYSLDIQPSDIVTKKAAVTTSWRSGGFPSHTDEKNIQRSVENEKNLSTQFNALIAWLKLAIIFWAWFINHLKLPIHLLSLKGLRLSSILNLMPYNKHCNTQPLQLQQHAHPLNTTLTFTILSLHT